MTDRWQRVEELCQSALELGESRRRAFLHEACAGDEELRREVESLLQFESRGDRFIEQPAMEVAAKMMAHEKPESLLGQQLGSYQILSLLGTGGMGVVYKARDKRLKRFVAIKILSRQLTERADLRQRFEREALALASLNHPNIASIYGLEESSGVQALVMELVEGVTLAERISQRPIPIDEALLIARQMAEALEYAHEKGIIHRDLKPANVKLTADGIAKVLDFGLAKAMEGHATIADLDDSPTLPVVATESGIILGTAAYMAPEQARGKTVDHRADIWSFGVVLYEMLTGKRLYRGETVSDTLVAVLKAEPDWNALPVEVPAAIRTLLRRCLTKDRRERIQAIGDIRIEIKEYLATPSGPEAAGPRPTATGLRREQLAWGFAGFLALCLLVTLMFFLRHLTSTAEKEKNEVIRFQFSSPEKTTLDYYSMPRVSSDGRRVAFTAQSNGESLLYVRSLDSLTHEALPGTEGAVDPFWSPDSQSIGFTARGKLKKIRVSDRVTQTLCDATAWFGGSWNRDGVIIFTKQLENGPIYRVLDKGGEPKPVTMLDSTLGQLTHEFPFFLPDGNHFLFYCRSAQRKVQGIYLGSLDSSQAKLVVNTNSNAVYEPSGHLLYWRDGSLFAQGFDRNRFEVSGDPFPVVERVGYEGTYGRALFSVSENGVLVYYPLGVGLNSQLTWFDRSGKKFAVVGEPGEYLGFDLSPDEKRAVLGRMDPQKGTEDLWLVDLVQGTTSRFTSDPNSESHALWSPDGSQIVFSSDREGPGDLYQKRSDGRGNEELVFKSETEKVATDWSRDGRFICYDEIEGYPNIDIWILPLLGDRKPTPFLRTQFAERSSKFSPDGKWVAYVSDESGKFEVYVQPLSGSGSKVKVSSDGGDGPMWRRDGKELFFVNVDTLISVPVKTKESLEPGSPKPLFRAQIINNSYSRARGTYAPTSTGQRFLVLTQVADPKPVPINVVLNWTAALKH